MYLEFLGIRIHVSFFFAAALAFAFNSGRGRAVAVVFLSALLHECAHIWCLRQCGVKDLSVTLRPGGAKIAGRGLVSLPYGAAARCALAGPAANLLLAGGLISVYIAAGSAFFREAAAINLGLGVCNLLPLSFLDGGRILESLLARKQKTPAPRWVRRGTDIFVISLLGILSVVLTLSGYEALFLLLFTLYCAICAFTLR